MAGIHACWVVTLSVAPPAAAVGALSGHTGHRGLSAMRGAEIARAQQSGSTFTREDIKSMAAFMHEGGKPQHWSTRWAARTSNRTGFANTALASRQAITGRRVRLRQEAGGRGSNRTRIGSASSAKRERRMELVKWAISAIALLLLWLLLLLGYIWQRRRKPPKTTHGTDALLKALEPEAEQRVVAAPRC